jgi:hypothetical protein
VKAPGPILGFKADKKLFDYQLAEGKERTILLHGWTDTRQPMVISETEKNKIDKRISKWI